MKSFVHKITHFINYNKIDMYTYFYRKIILEKPKLLQQFSIDFINVKIVK